ncbi:hypothetical protein AB7M49_007857 [Bradyrhizobium elkanii]
MIMVLLGDFEMLKVDACSPSQMAVDGNGLRFWLCGAVIIIYFSCFISLLSASRSAAASVQATGISTPSILLIIGCMLSSIATTAIFVFVRRAN